MRIAKEIEKEIIDRMEAWNDQVNDYRLRVSHCPDDDLTGSVDDVTFREEYDY